MAADGLHCLEQGSEEEQSKAVRVPRGGFKSKATFASSLSSHRTLPISSRFPKRSLSLPPLSRSALLRFIFSRARERERGFFAQVPAGDDEPSPGMDLPLALAALLLFLLVLLAAPPAALLLPLHIHRGRLRRSKGKARQLPPAEAESEARAPAEEDEGGEEKRRRRRARRNKQQQQQKKGGDGDGDASAAAAAAGGRGDEALPRRPRFPLASVAGGLQRRITARYDDLAQASQAQSLTIDQVREFINCLVDARNELLQKSENARRSFTIKKAMLSNARNRRSSYDHLRLCEQVDKLESEHERLKKDAAVYNYLQEQLQLSAPYKLMMELNDVLEKEAREHALATEEPEMSFEELLAQEKEDAAFWWRDGKLRSISGSK